MHFLPYNKSLREFSRDLRSHSTLSEILLWQKLRASQLRGYAFNRQKPLGNYIVDFYCRKTNLVIEIDGGSHDYEEAVVEDGKRQQILEELGVSFLRFSDWEVKNVMAFVLGEIGYFFDDFENMNGLEQTGFV
ncbi:MAG: endonuclease domain-containing protein [Algoriphagus sp.]|jgi:very-short-patch-repair endonuclease|uniref:endonuclease domain-containing protein n=1 Tax=Algoriphagus sp. TaxID=1872435 RepID=UPI002774E901|nr:endonuclease domain-containing protein [Algoriphagus sp.]MDP4957991.1 endonuclease domain-containing protein [Algoriphagus sp.]MDP5124435.1 endonuclease domain-containing protein [Algoriphagus sp.]